MRELRAHVAVRYTGKLTNGMVFDASSMHGNTPFEFDVGAGNHEERRRRHHLRGREERRLARPTSTAR